MSRFTDEIVQEIVSQQKNAVMRAAEITRQDLLRKMYDLRLNILNTYYANYSPRSYKRLKNKGGLPLGVDIASVLTELNDARGTVFLEYGVMFGPDDKDEPDYGYASRMHHKFGKKSTYDEETILINFSNGNHGGIQIDKKADRPSVMIERAYDAIDNDIESMFETHLRLDY